LLFRINTNKMRVILKTLLVVLLFQSCDTETIEKTAIPAKIKVVCTTSILTDWVLNIATEDVAVYSLLNKGVDPHVYKPSKKDLDLLRSADIIIYHGLHLEGKIIDVLEKIKGPLVIDVSKNFPKSAIITDPNFPASQDPHYWFDVELVKNGLATVQSDISARYPSLKVDTKANLQAYLKKMDSVTAEVQKKISTIEQDQRIIITTHDALSYFARAFGLTVNTLQGASTVSEFGLREITDLVNFICERRVKAIFLENIVSPQAMKSVQRGCQEKGWDVVLGPELLSDSLGQKEDQDTYLEMLLFNAHTITSYLTR